MIFVNNLNIISDIDNKYEMVEFFVNKEKTATVEEIEKNYSCIISCVIKEGVANLPTKNQIIHKGDRIICTIQKNQDKKLFNSFSRGFQYENNNCRWRKKLVIIF